MLSHNYIGKFGNKSTLCALACSVTVLVLMGYICGLSTYSAQLNGDSRRLFQTVFSRPFASSPDHNQVANISVSTSTAAVEPTITLPNCMHIRKEDPYPTSGEHLLGNNLCKAFTGKSRTDCVYRHPEIVNYILLTNDIKDNFLGF